MLSVPGVENRPHELGAPAVSVVLALYRSADTFEPCLASLAGQTFRDFEVIAVDSSPESSCRTIAAAYEHRLCLRYEHSAERLLPQEARNLGARFARGRLLVFSDPDCYAAPDWLATLVAAHRATGHAVVGALACHGDGAFDRAVHVTKFSKWLPGGPPHAVDMAPTANFLCPRALFEHQGGFRGDGMMGDATFSWDLRAAGETLWFEPRAVVAHHHLQTLASLLFERYRRGGLFARARMEWLAGRGGAARRQSALLLASSVLPVRLASNLVHVARHVRRAPGESGRRFLAALPVIALGMQATLLGEATGYARALVSSRLARGAAAAVDEGTTPACAGPRGSVSS